MAPLPKLVAIEFPGVLRDVSNPQRALEALGGEKAVRAYITTPPSSSVPPLGLNLRPTNQVSQSNVKADIPRATTNLFLIQIRPVSSGSPPSQNASSEKETSDVKLVGRVTAMTEFRSLADFQYHPSPVSIDPYGTKDGVGSSKQKDSQQSMACPPIAERVFHSLTYRPASKLTLDQCVDRLRPFRFARPFPERGNFNYWYQQYSLPAHLSQQQGVQSGPLIFIPGQPLGSDRRSLPDRLRRLPHRVSYAIDSVPMDAPVIPEPVVRGRAEFVKLVALLRLLFQKRPVWVRRALLLGVPEELRTAFKKAIECVAYSFQGSGPFFQACVKYGYDPRKDPGSRTYQVLELRCGHPLLEAVRSIRSDKSRSSVSTPRVNEQGKQTRKRKKRAEEEAELEEQKAGLKDVTLDLFEMPDEFILEDVPGKKNNFYQICDIKIPSIIAAIEKQPVTEKYDAKTGFFSETGFAIVHKQAKKAVFSLAEKFLASVRDEKVMKGDYRTVSKMVSKKRGRLQLKDVMKDPKFSTCRKSSTPTQTPTPTSTRTRAGLRRAQADAAVESEVNPEGAGQSSGAADEIEPIGDYVQQLNFDDDMVNIVDGENMDADNEDNEGNLDENVEEEDENEDEGDDGFEDEGDEDEAFEGEGLAGFEVYDSDNGENGGNDGGFEGDDDDNYP